LLDITKNGVPMKADIIHISGFDTYNTHDSGNYIVFNALRELDYDSKMILALGKNKPDKDTFLIPKHKIIDSIEEAKVIVLHDSLLSSQEIKRMYEKLGCQIIIITMTHFHLTTENSQGCPSYPELNSDSENVANQKLLTNKKDVIKSLPITLVYGSTYTGNITEKFDIYNKKVLIPLPADVPYCKSSKDQVRRHLGLDIDKKYVFWGTTQPQTHRKGKKLFDECLDHLWNNLEEKQRDKVVILNVGPNPGVFGKSSDFKTLYCGYQKTRKDMSVRYRAADVSVCTTTADAGPMMISESLCNETPVIAFDRSIAIDLCKNGETGYLIPNLNTEDMSNSIKKILFEDDILEMSEKSRKKYLTFHEKDVIIHTWNKLFKSLMEKNEKRS
jgi:glycosyltransferase involved in cell wall biosynthesis